MYWLQFLSGIYGTEMKIHLVLPDNNDHASLPAANHSDIIQSFCFAACSKNTALE